MTMTIIAGKFPLGELRITPGITGVMTRDEAFDALIRHMTGDWGDLDKHDWKQNDIALERGFRLFSRYVTSWWNAVLDHYRTRSFRHDHPAAGRRTSTTGFSHTGLIPGFFAGWFASRSFLPFVLPRRQNVAEGQNNAARPFGHNFAAIERRKTHGHE